MKGLSFLDECATPWCHEHCLEKIERDIWDFEEVAGVEDGEADVGDGESREVIVAERQIFRCPATQNDPLVPGTVLRWRYSANGLSNQSHNIISVVVKLQRGQLEKRFSLK